MERGRLPRLGLAAALTWVAVAPVAALDVDRDVVTVRSVDHPTVTVGGLDFGSLRAEVAMGAVVVGDPTARATSSACVPDDLGIVRSRAVATETYYYDVPYRVAPGVVVVRDGDGAVVLAATIDRLIASERFGHQECRYRLPGRLATDYGEQRGALHERIRADARLYAEERARAAVDERLFAVVLEHEVPLYTFESRKREYADLNEATALARAAYEATTVAGARADRDPGLARAIAIWEAALGESDPSDRRARVNRKVTSKVHESLGIAHLVRGDAASAVVHLESALRFTRTVTSRANGSGTEDLLARARDAADRGRSGPLATGDAIDLDELLRAADTHRGRIPIRWSPSAALPRLRAELVAFSNATGVERADLERDRPGTTVASRSVDRIEGRTRQASIRSRSRSR